MNLITAITALAALCGCVGMTATHAWAQAQGSRIINTPHNLSVSGGGGAHNIKATKEERICIFCHTPHHATSVTPLWSRTLPSEAAYDPYQSPTFNYSQPPRRPSRLCLSCHDGTIAIGLLSGEYSLDPYLATVKMPSDGSDPTLSPNLGQDLRNDHPISFQYPSPAEDPNLNDKLLAQSQGVRFDEGVYVECTSCHDPHNNEYGNFLVKDIRTQADALCTVCHNIPGWNAAQSSHLTGVPGGCMGCHTPHNSLPGGYLIRPTTSGTSGTTATLSTLAVQQSTLLSPTYAATVQNSVCYANCHRGATGGADIWSEFNYRTYSHPINSNFNIHTENETLPVQATNKHVVCVDCHNPHRAMQQNTTSTNVPMISGALAGVRGVDMTGAGVVQEARYEYEICFKCHAGIYAPQFTSLTAQRPLRLFPTFDLSLNFSSANPSFHPVTVDRKGTGRSLLASLQATMIRVICTDCHEPHGAYEPYLLKAQNWDSYPSATTDYPLCYRCHDRDYLTNPGFSSSASSAAMHRSHLFDHKVPCSTCHDPHGVSAVKGATSSNASFLVNFDTRYAGSNPVYNATQRSCTVSCHVTNPRTY